jgi:signal transduction histidine kinase
VPPICRGIAAPSLERHVTTAGASACGYILPMTDGATTSLPNVHAGVPEPLELASERTRRRGLSGPLINLGGWLLFGIAWNIFPFREMPWRDFLAIQPAYVLIGFLLSLLLGFVYDRLGVGPASFGRSLVVIIPASYAAGVVWTYAYYQYRVFGAPIVHSMIIGAPSPFNIPRGVPVISRAMGSAVTMFGWSLLRLGLQYNTALREQREQALRATAAARDAQLRMLAYQLNPHFLFNTLNSIRALINEDRQRARDMVTALSGYLRYALVERPLHVALLDEEVASVRGYLAIEKVRFEERLDVRLDVDPAALRCEVPAFLLNPLVENAVKHGAGGTTDTPLKLRVEARIVESDRLRLTVENNGGWGNARTVALAAGAGDDGLPGGLGLANVRARLAALHPGDHRIEIEEADGYVRVVVELPARFRSEAGT